jgi:hypothetical protein
MPRPAATPATNSSASESASASQKRSSASRSNTGSFTIPPQWVVSRTYRACMTETFVRSRQVIRFVSSNASGPEISTHRSTETSHTVTSSRSARYSVTGSSYSVGSSMWL